MVMKQDYKEKIRGVFNSDYCGIKDFVSIVLEPIFGGDILYSAPQHIAYNKDIVKNVVCVGEINGLYSNPVLIYDVTLADSCNIGRSRVYIQDAVRSDMLAYTNAFIVFHYENMTNRSWRFSFAQKEATKSAMKTAKRYTYLVGKGYSCRTIADRFANLYENKDTLTQESFLQAFSVEALSKEFFNEYTSFYNDFVNYVTNDDVMFPRFLNVAKKDTLLAEKYVRDYIKKLMGRLVFIQFLQKKGWLCNDLNYLQTLFASSTKAEKANFLDNVLEPMFFGVFNTDVKDRKDLFEKKKWNLNLLKKWNSFPYLNGGLFESDELDDLKLPIPGYFFSNPEKKDVVRKPDDNYYEDSCGLLDFFERYNFTIDENDPDDAEVGVDPEMLGKIFENLLEDNKDKGAFYTPKEIVQYMCQESIVQYLKTHTKESLHPAIEELIKEKNVNKLIQNKAIAKTVYTLLHDVKVCDPAIGSGAFPMGILNELYRARVLLYGFTDPINDFSPSNIKREIIQNNIYGVDIEKGAIDIARLRFWLSIVVDSEEPEPLPNFDYKFMQGNSLLEQFEGVDLSRIYDKPKYAEQISMAFDDETDAKDELWHNMIEYFSVTDHKHKQQLRNNIGDSVRKLLLAKASKAEIREKISSIDPTANQNFFLWHTWFADVFENGGFDIVIGNPPYIDAKRLKKQASQLKVFRIYDGTADIYTYFYELGLNLLRVDGIHTLITSNKWMRSEYGRKLRSLILENKLLYLIDFNRNRLFNATVDTDITIIRKSYNDGTNCVCSLDQYDSSVGIYSSILAKGQFNFPLTSNAWLITVGEKDLIKQRLDKQSCKIVDCGIDIYRGILTGCNSAYHLSNEQKEKLFDKQTSSIIKPLLRGIEIDRYIPKNHSLWLINVHNGLKDGTTQPVDINKFPSLKSHLDVYIDKLKKREDKGFTPYNLRNCAYLKEFDKPKIIWQGVSKRVAFSYDEDGSLYCDVTAFFMTGKNLKTILAILNSKLFEYSLLNIYLEGDTFKSKNKIIQEFPIPNLEKANLPMSTLVDHILAAKKKNPQADTSAMESEIDKLVYELYGLTEEEIRIVEGKE